MPISIHAPIRGVHRWAALLLALVAAGPASSALADPVTADQQRARNLFSHAATAYAEGRYDEAISLFRAGDELAPRADFSYNLAAAYEGKRETARALEHYRNYLRRSTEPQGREEVLANVRRLEASLARVGLQQVTVSSEPGANVVMDGRDVGTSPWTGELAPGPHEVEVRSLGAGPFKSSFELPKDRSLDLNLALPERPRSSLLRPLAWTFLGVAGAAASVGTIVGLVALSRESDLDQACGPQQRACPAGSEDDIATFRATRTASYVSFGMALASAVTSVVLFTQIEDEAPAVTFTFLPYDFETGGFHAAIHSTF